MKFDPRRCWDALSADQQRAVGEAALLLHVSAEAQSIFNHTAMTRESIAAVRPWERAEQVAWGLINDVFPVDADDFPGGPDLAAIGIRACRMCGCTDNDACAEGCSWVGPDLCSACAPKAAA